MLLIGLLFTAFILLILYIKNWYRYWEKKGIETSPFEYGFGNLRDALTLKRSIGKIHTDIYAAYKGYNYVAFYKFLSPAIIVRSPELIKEILQTSFSYFRDNDVHIDESHDLIFGKNPFSLKGDKWKKVRAQVSPSFSANKIKTMFPLMMENCKKLNRYLEKNPDARSETALELKELASKYTLENVASCAFGIEGRTFENPKAEFREIGRQLTEPNLFTGIKTLFVFMMPSLSTILKIKFFPDNVTNFLRGIVEQTIDYRKTKNIVRNDFIDVMTSLKTKINNESEFNMDDIVAHAGGFFIDGFETSSVAISFALYQIAANPSIQKKAHEEICEVISRYNGEITYEAMQEMTYLDCIFKESLRMHVPIFSLIKICTKEFQLPPILENSSKTSEKQTIEPGTQVVIPVYGLHMDEKYFNEPKRFVPERFDDDNKDNITKYTYIPFGEGPRMCLGQQFGIVQSKLCLASVIHSYNIKVNSKTKEPLELNNKHFMMAADGGLWLNFYKRQN